MVKAALFCLALNAYRETRGEDVAAQIAAMRILQNRATLNHTSICRELAKDRQFSWVRRYGIKHPAPVGEPDKAAWSQAKQMAKNINILNVRGITPKHVFFNTRPMGKRYKTKTKPVVIGHLIFY
jgi:spore germination cell wall hydrolase CwlJ-like protein